MNMENKPSNKVVEVEVKKPEQLSLSQIKNNKLRDNSNQSSLIIQRLKNEKDTLSTEDLKKLHLELLRITMEGDKLLR